MGIALLSAPQICLGSADALRLQVGYVYRLRCEGRLLVSAVGNDQLLRLEALPRELGCGAILKPLQASGRTNLVLETSSGTLVRSVELLPQAPGSVPKLEVALTEREGR